MEHPPGRPFLAGPPEAAHAVLSRLEDLDVTAWKAPATEVLPALYAAVLGHRPDDDADSTHART